MLRFATIFLVLSGSVFASAQALPDYLRMRKQHAVTGPVDYAKLDAIVGSAIVEAKGTVKGSFRVGDRTSLIFERADGKSQIIESTVVPDWLVGNEVPARLLVRVTRAEQYAPMRVALIGAAMESDIVEMEEAAARKAAANAVAAQERKSKQASKPAPKPSASAGKAPLSGLITRGGTQLTSRGNVARSYGNVQPRDKVVPIYAAFIKKTNGRLSNAQALRIADAVVGFSMHYKVDARLVMAILLVESGFDPNSVSRSGAMGLGQLMPGTAKWMGVADPFDTNQNLYGSVKLLRQHLDKYRRKTGDDLQSLILSLAAYNAGEGAVRRHGGVPPYRETQRYVRKVVGLYYKLAGQ